MNFISYLGKGFHNKVNLYLSNTKEAHNEYIKHGLKIYYFYPANRLHLILLIFQQVRITLLLKFIYYRYSKKKEDCGTNIAHSMKDIIKFKQ